MIEYTFELLEWPTETKGYHPAVYTLGTLSVKVQGETLILIDDALLVEFALFLDEWLSSMRDKEILNFRYASMDFEEEPLIALDWISTDFRLSSSTVEGPLIPHEEAIFAANEYIRTLGEALKKVSKICLASVIQRNATLSESPHSRMWATGRMWRWIRRG